MKIKSLFLFLFVILLSCTQTIEKTTSEKIKDPNCKEVIVISHRADWRGFPENSVEGIQSAIKMGVDVVELDVRKTKDGEIILMHDSKVDRTTTGKGKVSDLTMDEIRKFYLRNGVSIKTKHRVPTLREALLAAKGKVMVNLDKAENIFDEIYPILVETGTVNQIIMKGYKSPAEVSELYGDRLKEIIYMPIINLDKEGSVEKVKEFMETIKPAAFEFLFVSDTSKAPLEVKELLSGKSKIWYNTLWDTMAGGHDDDMALKDLDGAYGYLIDSLGATMLQTDRPAMLIDYLRESNRK